MSSDTPRMPASYDDDISREPEYVEVDHSKCPPGAHDFDPDGTRPDEQRRDEQGRRRCNDDGQLCFYCTIDDQYHHAPATAEPCFMVREQGWDVLIPDSIPVPHDWPGNEVNRLPAPVGIPFTADDHAEVAARVRDRLRTETARVIAGADAGAMVAEILRTTPDWSADTLNAIRDVCVAAGFKVSDDDEAETVIERHQPAVHRSMSSPVGCALPLIDLLANRDYVPDETTTAFIEASRTIVGHGVVRVIVDDDIRIVVSDENGVHLTEATLGPEMPAGVVFVTLTACESSLKTGTIAL